MLARIVVAAVLLGACAHPAANGQRAATTAPEAPRPAAEPPPPSQVSAAHETPRTARTASVDFVRDVRPILESRCQPCHFAGGRMYERLPFDKPETIRQLGTKLFTRIKDEASQTTIRHFLAETQ